MCPAATEQVVCRCLQVTESQIVDCIAVSGAETVREVAGMTGAGSGCLACHCEIKELLAARVRTAARVVAR